MSDAPGWYVVQQANGQCEVVIDTQDKPAQPDTTDAKRWGPFASQRDAIAHRVGLIRAGKCKPV